MSEDIEKKIRIGVTSVLMPMMVVILGFFMVRLINLVDDMNSNVNQSLIEIRAMQENMENHEKRIHNLERWRDYNYEKLNKEQ